ncbi:MAG: hypothetical protein OJF49_003024 [Ktedonobacterales bacterium]|jgi:hypothetical protein|nr:MAG: hypothetical protein OJF49_003024 [Ktedonobacterales bacterium]
MIRLPHVDPFTAIVIGALIILLLTPLFGDTLGRAFETFFVFIGEIFRSLAQGFEAINAWTWGQGTKRMQRHADSPAPTPAPAVQPATQPTQDADPADGSYSYDLQNDPYATPDPTGSLAFPTTSTTPAVNTAGSAAATTAPDATTPAAPPEPAHWGPEAIVTELIYFALVIVVALADLVFSAERLAVVLFNQQGGVNFGPLNFLRDLGAGLSGLLFIGIGALTGMLLLDFLGALPGGVHLFPGLSPRMRKVLGWTSFFMLLLTVAAGAMLWILGQTVVDNLGVIFPPFEYAVDGLLAVVLIVVVGLGFWGAVRGIATIGTILLVLLGFVFVVFAHALKLIARFFEVVGEAINDIFDAIYRLFHHEAAPRPEVVPDSQLSIVGVGQRGSEFTVQLGKEVTSLVGPRNMRGVGVYVQNKKDHRKHLSDLKRASVIGSAPRDTQDLAPDPNHPHPLSSIADNIEHAYRDARDTTSTRRHLIWVIDPNERNLDQTYLLQSTVDMLKELRENPRVPGLAVTVVCLLPSMMDQRLLNSGLFEQLAQLSHGQSDELMPPSASIPPQDALIVNPTFLLQAQNQYVGEITARHLFARSLAASLTATTQPGNHELLTVLANVRQEGYPFVAISTDSAGVVASKPDPRVFGSNGGTVGEPLLSSAERNTQTLAKRLFNGEGAASVQVKPNQDSNALIAALCIAPFGNSANAAQYRNTMTRWFNDGSHAVPLVSVVAGPRYEGVNITSEHPKTFGGRYCQVAFIYGVENINAALDAPDTASAFATSARASGTGVNSFQVASASHTSPDDPTVDSRIRWSSFIDADGTSSPTNTLPPGQRFV